MASRQKRWPDPDRLIQEALPAIVHTLEEGIHIVDAEGRTVLYNPAMEAIEGLSAAQVLGKPLLEVFPGLAPSESTLLTVLQTGQRIESRCQTYLNLSKKRICTINTTFPVLDGDRIVGAVEIAQNYTDVDQLSETILDLQNRLRDPQRSGKAKPRSYTFGMLIGRHPSYLAAVAIAKKAALTDASVLIEGETGTGKELFAQSIHNASARRTGPFIAMNCAALPDSLLESILFGTMRGSYTGAEERPGLFEQASGGTLFLDEINSMSLPLQAKMLRALQEASIRRLGGLKDILVDVRIIAACNEALVDMMRAGTFRKDLYYRLDVIDLRIPPLRERPEDIPLLVEHFLRHYSQRMGVPIPTLSARLMQDFLTHTWNGNVRELQNLLESMIALSGGEPILGREHLPARAEILAEACAGHGAQVRDKAGPKATRRDTDSPIRDAGDLRSWLEDLERERILEVLGVCHGNVSKAAVRLGISRQSLQYKLKHIGSGGACGLSEVDAKR